MSESISIVMPAYRAESSIVGAVESVLAQSYGDWRLIVVADDAIDYEAVLGRVGITDKRVVFVNSGDVGSGASRARNPGLEKSTTRYGALLDADDPLQPTQLAQLMEALAEHGIVT